MKETNHSDELNVVHLESALLCANCEMIVGETRNGKCPMCGSGAQLSLFRLLGGTLAPLCEPSRNLRVCDGLTEMQANPRALDRSQRGYDELRPHEGIGMQTRGGVLRRLAARLSGGPAEAE